MATGEHDGGDNDVQRSESLHVSVCSAIGIAVCSTIGIAVCVCETIIVQRSGSLYAYVKQLLFSDRDRCMCQLKNVCSTI